VGYDTDLFTFDDDTSGRTELFTDDTVTYEPPVTKIMRIYQTSIYSTHADRTAYQEFTVEIRNRCYSGVVTAPVTTSTYTFNLYDLQTNPATLISPMTQSLPNCGDISHILYWSSTDADLGITADTDTGFPI